MIVGQILVALKSRDRMQEILPIIEKIAKPDMKVTFLGELRLRGFIRPVSVFNVTKVKRELS
ncbi:MAG: hypothetical protein ACREQP_01735 [Candidatus Binatia bacterium]